MISFKFQLIYDKDRDFQIISQESVVLEFKIKYDGYDASLEHVKSKGEGKYICVIGDEVPRKVKKKIEDLVKNVRDYAGITFWWYYKFVSSGRIYERYQFEFLEDGTPVRLSYDNP